MRRTSLLPKAIDRATVVQKLRNFETVHETGDVGSVQLSDFPPLPTFSMGPASQWRINEEADGIIVFISWSFATSLLQNSTGVGKYSNV